jgi:hypothetical protein
MDFMICLFIDTLFFGLLFPEGVCEMIPDKTLCISLKPIFPFGNPTQCAWEPSIDEYGVVGGTCSLLPPPDSVMFSTMLTILIIIFGLPLSLFLWSIYLSILVRDPVGLNSKASAEAREDNTFEFGTINVHRELEEIINLASNIQDAESFDKNHFYILHKAKATSEILGSYNDGSPMPLSFFEWLKFGTRANLIRSKLSAAHLKCEKLIETLNQFNLEDEHHKDVVLLQHFVLEQFSSLRKLILEKELFNFDTCKPKKVGFIKWAIAWAFCNGVFGFFLYWIFAWGVKNGGPMFDAWGETFGLASIQDLFVCIPLKVFIINGLLLKSLRPQLKQIFHTLNNVSCCKMLKNSDDFKRTQIVHYLSSSCRAGFYFPQLPSSKLLHSIDDSDYLICQKSKKSRINYIALAIFSFPVLFSFFGDFFAEFSFEILIPSIWGGFLLFNDLIFQISVYLLVLFYISVFGYIFVLYKYIKPRRLSRRTNALYQSKLYKRLTKKSFFSYLDFMDLVRFLWFKGISNYKTTWNNMNRSFYNQGRAIDVKDLKSFKLPVSNPKIIKNLPEDIRNLCQYGKSWNLKDINIKKNKTKYSFIRSSSLFDFFDPYISTEPKTKLEIKYEFLSFDLHKITNYMKSSNKLNERFINEIKNDSYLFFNKDIINSSEAKFEFLTFDLRKYLPESSKSDKIDLVSDPMSNLFENDQLSLFSIDKNLPTDYFDTKFYDENTNTNYDNTFLSIDLLSDWQFHPFKNSKDIVFELLTFEISSKKKSTPFLNNSDHEMELNIDDKNNFSSFKLNNIDIPFEFLSFGISKFN